MCRLVGYCAKEPKPLVSLLGPRMGAFEESSREPHRDGWGVASVRGDEVVIIKGCESGYESERLRVLSLTEKSDLGLAHLRWATPGLDVNLENTHPFGEGDVAFAHNGSIGSIDQLERLVEGYQRVTYAGTTDSERYFQLAMAFGLAKNPADALRKAAEEIATSLTYSALNAVVVTPWELVAMCWYRPGSQGADLAPDYFDMGYACQGEQVMVASSSIYGSDWSPLRNGELLRVERHSLNLSIEEVGVGSLR